MELVPYASLPSVRIDGGIDRLGPGDLARYPAGSSHSPRSETGCRLLVFYPEG